MFFTELKKQKDFLKKMFGKLINALRRNSSNEAVLCRRQVKNLKRQVKKHELNFTKESGIISNRCCANTAKTAEISGENFDFSWEKPPFFLRCFDGTGCGNGVRI